MCQAANQVRRLVLAVVLVGLHPWIAAADEKHSKAAKAGGNGNASAARVANATQHKAMVQQQVAIQRQNMLQQQKALHQNALQHQNNLQHAGVGTENRLAHRNGVGTENRAGHRNGLNQNQNRNLETGPMVSSLHSVVGHLNQADHDYDGHRVQAIHSLGQAIHTLQAGTNGNRTGTGVGGVGKTNPANHAIAHPAQGKANSLTSTGKGKGTGSQRMSQAESDAHLRQAHQELTALEAHISGGNGTLAAHHQQAHSHIQQALQHLNSALATR